jgi:UDP-N-acetylglucosamine 2-epimerase (non-hydrolysing)
MQMPEEINRIVTDSLTDFYFTTSNHANQNLLKLGAHKHQIFFVGNVMIDTLFKNMSRFKKPQLWNDLNLQEKKYFVMTLHRPSNVDEEQLLSRLINQIVTLSKEYPIIFPVHPRTIKKLNMLKLNFKNLHYINPLSYLEFNFLVKHAFAVITDSGGITEETTVLNIPCITLRENTERPETCEIGTNELVGNSVTKITDAFKVLLSGKWKQGQIPVYWDGKAAERIVNHLVEIYQL